MFDSYSQQVGDSLSRQLQITIRQTGDAGNMVDSINIATDLRQMSSCGESCITIIPWLQSGPNLLQSVLSDQSKQGEPPSP